MRPLAIFSHRNIEALHNPLRFGVKRNLLAIPFAGQRGIRPEMNEHAKLIVTKPGHTVVLLSTGGGGVEKDNGEQKIKAHDVG